MEKVYLKTLQRKLYSRTLFQKVSCLKPIYLLYIIGAFGRVETITGETGFGNNEIVKNGIAEHNTAMLKSDSTAKDIILMNKETSRSSKYGVQEMPKSDVKSSSKQSLDTMHSEAVIASESIASEPLKTLDKSSGLEKSSHPLPSHLLGYEDGSYDGHYEDDHLYVF